jgi:protein-tyrosine phosphatase
MVQPKKLKRRNVLVVCHGNICRSPLAGRILKDRLGDDFVRDRGLSVREGLLAAKKVRDWATDNGYDLEGHRSVRVRQADVDWANIILYMDGGNRERLLDAFEGVLPKLVCLGSCIGAEKIADPNYVKRGPELDALLAIVEKASLVFANEESTVG